MNEKVFLLSLLILLLLCSCSSKKSAWEKAKGENTIQAYEEFLNSFPDSPMNDEARETMENLSFEKALSTNTLSAYENFLVRYPQGGLADKARLKIQELSLAEAVSMNTFSSYEDFLNEFPGGPFAEKARSRLEKLYRERHPHFRDTKTVKIIVDQSYGKAADVDLPFEEAARDFCEYAGLTVVGAATKNYDLTFKIQARGEPDGASYGDVRFKSKNYQYSSAWISVTLSLKVPGIPAYTKSCRGFVPPPKKLVDFVYSDPSSAPFPEALINSEFYHQLLRVMQELYGPNTLILALKNYSMAEELLMSTGKAAVEPLIAALGHRDEMIRSQATSALGKIGDSRAIEPLSKTLEEDKVVFVRKAAVRALEGIEDSRSLAPLVCALKDEEPDVRSEALNALGRLHWEPKSNDEKVSFYICRGEIGKIVEMEESAVEPLLSALEHPDKIVRQSAISALGQLRDGRAIEPLLTVMKSKDRYLQWGAVEALENITGKLFGEDLGKWQRWWKKNKKKYQRKSVSST